MHRVLVYGGKGALGSTLVKTLKGKGNFVAISIDLAKNEDANVNIVLSPTQSWEEQTKAVESEIEKSLGGEKLDAVLCVAGGWAGGNVKSKDVIKNTELMWKVSVQTSVHAAHLAALHLKENGLLVLPGSAGAAEPSPGMIGYGIAKAAVHHLVRSCALTKESGLPNGTTTVGIMPVILDTEMNRKSMPKADFTSWTPLSELSEKLIEWTSGKDLPKNGSLVRIITEKNVTKYVSE